MAGRAKWAGAALAILLLGTVGIAVSTTGDAPVSVRVEPVETGELNSLVTASGVIQPREKVDISADVPGRVMELAVEEGQWVNEGELLLVISPAPYEAAARRARAILAQARAQAAQAQANLTQAESDWKRAERMGGTAGLISRVEVEQARTAVEVARSVREAARFTVEEAQAGLEEAQEALSKTRILAPMSGRVTRLNIRRGENAVIGTMNNPGSLLLTIADLSEMEARVRVDEADLTRIQDGDSANVRLDAFEGLSIAGRVVRRANSALAPVTGSAGDEAARYEVIVSLAQVPEDARPDLTATAEIVTARRKDVVAIPLSALTSRSRPGEAAEEGVWVVSAGNTVRFQPVVLGIASKTDVEIEEGLQARERIVVGPYQTVRTLREGAAVVPARTPPGSGRP